MGKISDNLKLLTISFGAPMLCVGAPAAMAIDAHYTPAVTVQECDTPRGPAMREEFNYRFSRVRTELSLPNNNSVIYSGNAGRQKAQAIMSSICL